MQPLSLFPHLSLVMQLRYGFIFLIVMAWGCFGGERLDEQPDGRDFDPLLFIEQGPDTFIYPDHQYFTSLRFPISRFGPEMMTDDNPSTFFSTAAGSNHLEGFDLFFPGLVAKKLVITAAEDPYLAAVEKFEVWQNDSLLGYFPSGASIIFNRPLYRLSVRIHIRDGWNEMQLELGNRLGPEQRYRRELSKLYNSRPAGISGFQLFDFKDKKIPFCFMPMHFAGISLSGNGDPLDKYFMEWNGTRARIRTGNLGEERRLIYTFKNYVPALKVSAERDDASAIPELGFIGTDGSNYGFHWERKRLQFELNPLSVQKGFTVIVTPGGTQPVSFGAIKIWSGKRWWQVLPDSLETFPEKRKRFLLETPLRNWIDQPVVYKESRGKFEGDSLLFSEPEDTLLYLASEHWETEAELLIRSTGTLDLHVKLHSKTEGLDHTYQARFSARWYWSPEMPELLAAEGWLIARSEGVVSGFSKAWTGITVKVSQGNLEFTAPVHLRIPGKR